MIPRPPEPELMDEAEQARAYAEADFDEPNAAFIERVEAVLEAHPVPAEARVVDLGCGPADIAVRLAERHPGWRVDAIDGAAAMLAHAKRAADAAGVGDRLRLVRGRLPEAPSEVPVGGYDLVLSNSLLHHLPEPDVLWRTIDRIARPGAPIVVMDLFRPEDEGTLDRLVETYAADAPPVLRRDFRASLHAAFTVEEVRAQLGACAASLEVRACSDRHLLVRGTR
ncbi:MAG: SAM-dependent methyltransferase [Myxococcales bacterium]|nr:SAM-dependent methyltransferase [Myxococcales bacterium]